MASTLQQQLTRQNHYVPIWYQKGFIVGQEKRLQYLDLNPSKIKLLDGREISEKNVTTRAPKSCFWAADLYTTRFGGTISDEVERRLFGAIDDFGANAVRALVSNDARSIHRLFERLFEYLDAQMLRTPKGLDWIRSKYPDLTQLDLMIEMQGLRQMHCTMWYECVREIVSAENSEVKFIVTDHPVTVYNAKFPPGSAAYNYPDAPSIELKGTQTIFCLDANHCLILSNLEYANDPANVDPTTVRTNARYFGQTIARTDGFIRTRKLASSEVISINRILKAGALKYIAASDAHWLYPERAATRSWEDIGKILLPPIDELGDFGGEVYIGYKDGTTHYQDALGRTSGAHKYLRKERPAGIPKSGDLCGCGSGRVFRKCCEGLPDEERPSWDVYSIRERNLMFCLAVNDILGLNDGSDWNDVRRNLSDDQVRRVHEAYASLWPKDTDFSVLLPRPDKRVFRALYLGAVDPRTVAMYVTSWLVYFDEIIIANTFVNGSNIKPDYSPIRSPSKYKAQTLKNVLLLMMLEPFIEAGLVHFIPDPTDFNDGLRRQVWGMAESRFADSEMDEKDLDRLKVLAREDFGRGVWSFPVESLRRMVRDSSPELAPEEIDGVIEHAKAAQLQDPLALLQPLVPGEDGAQLHVTKGFNLELALFLAQLTGAVIYTDLALHWRQLHMHTTAANKASSDAAWGTLAARIAAIGFILDASPQAGLRLRTTGKLEDIRATFRSVAEFARAQSESAVGKKAVKKLTGELHRAPKNIRREWQAMLSANEMLMPLCGRMEASFPEGGFQRNTVNRLLLTFGRAQKIRAMPMAMYIKLERTGSLTVNKEQMGSD
jgi:hypothetical protein